MNDGWLIYTNENYAGVASVLVTGLLEFSEYDIHIITTGYDFPITNSRVKCRRDDSVDVKHFSEVCYYKNLCLGSVCDLDHYVILDADMVPNVIVDDLMKLATINNRSYPLHAGHGCDPNNQEESMRRLGVTQKSMPYVYSTYMGGKSCQEFLSECWRLSQEWKCDHYIPPNTGENILNCMLWKRGVTEQTNCWLPYVDTIPHYLSCGKEKNPLEGYYAGKALSYHFFHGYKDVTRATSLLEALRSQDMDNPLLDIRPRLNMGVV